MQSLVLGRGHLTVLRPYWSEMFPQSVELDTMPTKTTCGWRVERQFLLDSCVEQEEVPPGGPRAPGITGQAFYYYYYYYYYYY
jgi:hypothetical protein